MAKIVVQHVCSECGTASPRWLGRCPGCGAFGTLVEEMQGVEEDRHPALARAPVALGDVSALTDGFSTAFVGAAIIALAGAGLAGITLRSASPAAAEGEVVDAR